ncbi:response regulator [Nocardia goodfellowii]|uniref:DNA-binding NarL/FixJ family response regulator n=1 Tax=Nocardia goodfellowii TaxID=882446 RepID=A0ABS4Q751_9NOCA|nr:response regulator transcription factor [Nocardia goodfellowii]MBP2187504.1 DNA-binding NarL/FixJ family response regulator [Nocardia goodfellowii]
MPPVTTLPTVDRPVHDMFDTKGSYVDAAMDAGRPLRIIVADDQASVREGIALMLDVLPDIDVVATAADGQQALERVAEHHPDAVLLDLRMPVLDGVETATRLAADHPDVAVVILSTFADDISALSALRAGARSFLTKDVDRAGIVRALHSAVSGMAVLDARVQDTLLAAARGIPEPAQLPDGLTRREAEILALVARGMTNTEICEALFLTANTVKTHINRIFAKTGSRDRVAAIDYARRHGLA